MLGRSVPNPNATKRKHTNQTNKKKTKNKSWLADANGNLDDKRRLIAGLGAGVTEAILIVTPFDVRISAWDSPLYGRMRSINSIRTRPFYK